MCISKGPSENRNYSRCFQKKNLLQEVCYTNNEISEKSSRRWWENLRSAKVEVGGREKSMLLKFQSKGQMPSWTMEDNSMGVGATEETYLVRDTAQRKERGEISYFLPSFWSPRFSPVPPTGQTYPNARVQGNLGNGSPSTYKECIWEQNEHMVNKGANT